MAKFLSLLLVLFAVTSHAMDEAYKAAIDAVAGKWEYLPDEPGGISHNRKATVTISESKFITEDSVTKVTEKISWRNLDAEKHLRFTLIDERTPGATPILFRCEFGNDKILRIRTLDPKLNTWLLAFTMKKLSDDPGAGTRAEALQSKSNDAARAATIQRLAIMTVTMAEEKKEFVEFERHMAAGNMNRVSLVEGSVSSMPQQKERYKITDAEIQDAIQKYKESPKYAELKKKIAGVVVQLREFAKTLK